MVLRTMARPLEKLGTVVDPVWNSMAFFRLLAKDLQWVLGWHSTPYHALNHGMQIIVETS